MKELIRIAFASIFVFSVACAMLVTIVSIFFNKEEKDYVKGIYGWYTVILLFGCAYLHFFC